MTYDEIGTAIRTRFLEEVARAENLPVVPDNGPGKFPDGKDFDPVQIGERVLWVATNVRHVEGRQQDIGASNKRIRRTGIFTIRIMSPVGEGTRRAETLAEKICLLFSCLNSEGVTFRTASIVNSQRVGQYWQINVDCPWYAETFSA